MATLSHAESRRLYSWWWDSHISPKNSKWLQENLTDMDAKVKAMIKLIEEDADSFARRAEMYYKKRPELMKLVEEFYRAYRALAERYDHATGELRQAHRTMAEAFPNQVPFVLPDDSPSGSSITEAEPHTPEMPHPIRAFIDPDDLHRDALEPSSSHSHTVRKNGAYSEESDSVTSNKGLKKLDEMFGSGEVVPHHANFAEGRVRKGLNFHEQERSLHDGSHLSNENQNLKTQVMSECERVGKVETEVQTLKEVLSKFEAEKEAGLLQYQQSLERLCNLESEVSRAQEAARGLDERANKAESEVETLKQALAKLEAEKEAGLLQYQQSLERLCNLESEVSRAQEDARGLDERANKAESEVETLKQALAKLEAEKEAGLLQYQRCLERISSLEAEISCTKEDVKELNEQANKSEIEAQILKEALARLEAEKETGLLQYKECLEKISNLEIKISCAEENAKRFNEQAGKAETKVRTLKEALSRLDEEKETIALQYQQCLEKISNRETEISHAQEEIKRLNSEIVKGVVKLNSAKEQFLLLERANQSLHSDLEALIQKMGLQTQELTEKHKEVERLRICIEEEHLHFLQAEAAIKTLQNMHSQTQERQISLAVELQNAVQMLKDMELRNHGLEEEVQKVKEENKSLKDQNLSSALSIKNLQDEIFGLRKMNRNLEEDVELRLDQRNALQQEIYCLKQELNDLNRRHMGVMEQVESVGLNPKYLGSSVKELQDENSMLKEICQKDKDEKVALLEKLENMEKLLEKNTILENSLSDVNAELKGLREKVKAQEESCQFLQREKSTLVAEKSSLVSQLEIMSENMEKHSEKNIFLENSLFDANVELRRLKMKAKSLEESCQSLDNAKSALLSEKDTLVSQLESIQQRLENLEKKYSELEEMYSGLGKEKETTLCEVKELRVTLDLEKQERASFTQSSETRLAALEKQIHVLQEEGQWRNKEFEEELDRAMHTEVEIFILQRLIQDMEEKNFSLLIECQEHFEASKLSEKLISKLEQGNVELQVETKSLFDQIEKLREGIYQVLKSLEIDPDYGCHDKINKDQILLKNITRKIEDTKFSFLKTQDEKQQLLFENSVLVTLLRQLGLEAENLESERNTLDKDLKIRTEELLMLQNEKHKFLEMNERLELEVRVGVHREEILKADMEKLQAKVSDFRGACLVLQTENSMLLKEIGSLGRELSDSKVDKCMLEEENSIVLSEAMALGNLSLIFESFSTEKTEELRRLGEDLDCLRTVNGDLQKEVGIMEEKSEMLETENLHLKESVAKLKNELNRVRNVNDQLNNQVTTGKELFCQKEVELSDAEQKLRVIERENAALRRDIEGLNREKNEAEAIRRELEKHVLELSVDNTRQSREIGCFRGKFEAELGKLREEIEELKTREGNLSYELQERRDEVKLQENDAAKFYVELQTSSICEALLEGKVQELVGICESLEGEDALKTKKIEQLNERLGVLEGENEGLKAELAAYLPVIVSLRGSIISLEDHALLQTKILKNYNREPKDAELGTHLHQEVSEDQSAALPDGVSNLQELQTRVKAIETAVMEMERHAILENLDTKVKLEAAMKEIQELNRSSFLKGKEVQTSRDIVMQPEGEEHRDEPIDDLKPQKTELKMSKVRNGIRMKDIPLDQVSDYLSCDQGVGPYGMSQKRNGETDDQMLELWETAEQDFSLDLTVNKGQKLASSPTESDTEYHQTEASEEQKSEYPSSELQVEKELGVDKLEVSKRVIEPRQEGNKRKILERLASDAQKLTNLQITVNELKKKVEIPGKSKNAKGIEYDTMKGQLQGVEETIMQLVDSNGKLTKKAEESLLSSDGKAVEELEEPGNGRKRRVLEQARRGSEKIGRLQLKVQRIQFDLLKLEEDKSKGKTGITDGRAKVLLRDFLYSGGKGNHRQKKAPCCACVRPSTNGE